MTLKSKKTTESRTNETVSENTEAVFIYVGPTTKKISRYTVFKNGYPHHLKQDIEDFPLLKNLFIHPSKLAEFEKNVATKGTIENIHFNEVKKYFDKAVR